MADFNDLTQLILEFREQRNWRQFHKSRTKVMHCNPSPLRVKNNSCALRAGKMHLNSHASNNASNQSNAEIRIAT